MKVIHLISGGDSGGAKTHVHSLLQGLSQHIQADMVCFMDGPFTQEGVLAASESLPDALTIQAYDFMTKEVYDTQTLR